MRDGDRTGAWSDPRDEILRLAHDELGASELPRPRDRAVLVRRRQHLVARLQSQRAQDRVQARGRVGHEDEIVGAGADERGQSRARRREPPGLLLPVPEPAGDLPR